MITLWHNPRCSKSRGTLALITASGAGVTIRNYLEDAPDQAEIEAARQALGSPPVIDMIRTAEPAFRDLNLTDQSTDAALIAAMVKHPVLIQRPIAFRGDKAVIGRPPEAVRALL